MYRVGLYTRSREAFRGPRTKEGGHTALSLLSVCVEIHALHVFPMCQCFFIHQLYAAERVSIASLAFFMAWFAAIVFVDLHRFLIASAGCVLNSLLCITRILEWSFFPPSFSTHWTGSLG